MELKKRLFVQFGYDKTIKDRAIIATTAVTDEAMYRFISPICLVWFIFARLAEEWAIP